MWVTDPVSSYEQEWEVVGKRPGHDKQNSKKKEVRGLETGIQRKRFGTSPFS
jgi:hypothetical protein